MGSPPRMRGKEWFRDENLQQPGITPAYAGKSALMPAVMAGSQDHPRVCGEKYSLALFLGLHQGSPPRMRGKGGIPGSCRTRKGITPAYAGKSGKIQKWPCAPWDHPRVCGEKFDNPKIVYSEKGSPPRMRGKARGTLMQSLRPRITPAYAGKRITFPIPVFSSWDHPRVCGEKTKKIP